MDLLPVPVVAVARMRGPHGGLLKNAESFLVELAREDLVGARVWDFRLVRAYGLCSVTE
jgi:hypothetical protein